MAGYRPARRIWGELRIPKMMKGEPVTEIDEAAFYYMPSLTGVVIPRGVTVIGDEAFRQCYGLKRVVLPEGLVEIGAGSFMECRSLQDIVFPKSLRRIGDGAFAESGLTSILLPAGVSVKDLAFYDCKKLTKITKSLILGWQIQLIGASAEAYKRQGID